MNETLLETSKDFEPGYAYRDPSKDGTTDMINKAPVYQKQGEVSARCVETDEEWIETYIDGKLETRKKAIKGDIVITNPTGEIYAVESRTFNKRYEPNPDKPGYYIAKGKIRAIRNPYGYPIAIVPSWGGLMYGDSDCLLAVTVDTVSHVPEKPGNIYIIDSESFDKTYREVFNN